MDAPNPGRSSHRITAVVDGDLSAEDGDDGSQQDRSGDGRKSGAMGDNGRQGTGRRRRW